MKRAPAVWLVLPDVNRVAIQVVAVPRRGDIVRFGGDGEPYEVALIDHTATRAGTRRGMRHASIVIRLNAIAARAS
jgi:predicted N-formylglutamate amidohydrolase